MSEICPVCSMHSPRATIAMASPFTGLLTTLDMGRIVESAEGTAATEA